MGDSGARSFNIDSNCSSECWELSNKLKALVKVGDLSYLIQLADVGGVNSGAWRVVLLVNTAMRPDRVASDSAELSTKLND